MVKIASDYASLPANAKREMFCQIVGNKVNGDPSLYKP